LTAAFLTQAAGVLAAICSMTSFAPQLVKIWREKDASSVSLHMYLVTVTGFALWIGYGLGIGSWPVIGANSVCLMMSAAVLALRLRYGRGPRTSDGRQGPLNHPS
jgi:MtN3 and saliva related transmembrane protein